MPIVSEHLMIKPIHKYREAANTIPLRILSAACSNFVLSSMFPMAADACGDGVRQKHAASDNLPASGSLTIPRLNCCYHESVPYL